MTPQPRKALFSTSQWIAFIGTIAATSVCLTAFAFQTFETKEDSKEKKADIVKRLDSLELKVDALLINRGIQPAEVTGK